MERKLLDYLPLLLREHPQFRAMMDAQQPEFETAWAAAAALQDDLFVLTAGGRGLSRWERLLGMTSKASDSSDVRRSRILAALNRQLPYTLPQLQQVLNGLYGPGAASAEIPENSYILQISVPYTDTWADTMELVDAMSPQNLLTRYIIRPEAVHLTAHIAAVPCRTAASYTVRLPDIDPKNGGTL